MFLPWVSIILFIFLAEIRNAKSVEIKASYFHRTFLPDSHKGKRFPITQVVSGVKLFFRCATLCSLSSDCQLIAYGDKECLFLKLGEFESDTRSLQTYSSFVTSPDPYLIKYGSNFSNAKAVCGLIGGIIYTPYSRKEGEEMYRKKNTGDVWVGIQKRENRWYDATGKDLTDSIDWQFPHPYAADSCAFMNSDGEFESNDCALRKEFLCLV